MFSGVYGKIDHVLNRSDHRALKKQQHEREKVSGLQEAVGEVRRQMNDTEEAAERPVRPLEQAVLGLAEAKDRTSRVESDLAGLRAAMADDSEKVEEVRREVAGVKAQLSDYCPRVNQDLTNLARELATLKEEMRELRGLKAAMADQRQRHEKEIRDVKHEVELLRKASDSQRESLERETQAVADVRNVVGQLAGDLANLRSENGHHRSGVEEMARANQQLRAKAARLKQRIEVLEQENRRLSEVNEVVKRDLGEVMNAARR
jgi:chromosome segregation ATPase